MVCVYGALLGLWGVRPVGAEWTAPGGEEEDLDEDEGGSADEPDDLDSAVLP
jgi:hypothetical protein